MPAPKRGFVRAHGRLAALRSDVEKLADALYAFRFGPEGPAARDGALFVAWVLTTHAAPPTEFADADQETE